MVMEDAIKFVYKGSAGVSGAILDNGLGIPEVKVYIYLGSALKDSAISDEKGNYLAATDIGVYQLIFSKSGYLPNTQNINVATEDLVKLDINLTQNSNSPVIGNVSSEIISEDRIAVSFTTDKPAQGEIVYGLTTGYGLTSGLEALAIFSHVIELQQLQRGVTYHYQVTARDGAARIGSSSDFTFYIPNINAPDSFSIQAGDTRVYLNWASNTNSDVVGFDLYRQENRGQVVLLAQVGNRRNSYIDHFLTNGVLYSYYLRARDLNNLSGSPTLKLSTPPTLGVDVVIDNKDSNVTVTNFTNNHMTGWAVGGWGSSDYNGDCLIKVVGTSGEVTYKAPAGTFHIDITYPSGYDNCVAKYTLTHSGGSQIFNVDQNKNANDNGNIYWNRLGTVPYTLNGSSKVVVSEWNIGNIFSLADAIRFVSLNLPPVTSEEVSIPERRLVLKGTLNDQWTVAPNPFNPKTEIKFQLVRGQRVQMKVLDLQGREKNILISKNLLPGNHTIEWNAKDLPAGVYFIQLKTGNLIQTKTVLLLK